MQTGRNVVVARKRQAGLGQPESGAGALVFRINAGQGLTMEKAKVRSNENRRDGQTSLGRHGSRRVAGSYPADVSLGTFDDLIEDLLRGTWAAALTITEATASLTSITTTTSTIVASAGSWITAGLRVGDVIRMTGHATAANNDKNLLITALTTSTITVAGTPLTADAVADTAFSIIRPQKLVVGDTPVKRYYTFEEHEIDQDASQVFTDVRTGSLQIRMEPDGMVTLTFGMVGRDMNVAEGGSAPVFTTPTETTTIGLVAVDSQILVGGSQIVTLTGLDLTLARAIATQPVIGSHISPDVFDALLTINGTITGIREDMTQLGNFIDEDHMTLHLLLVDPSGTAPQGFLSIYIPLFTIDGNSRGFGEDGAMIQTMPIEAGKLLGGTGHDHTMVKFQSTAVVVP